MCQYARTCAICVAPEIILFRWVEAGKTVHRTIWPELAPHGAAGTKTAESQGKPRKNTTNEQQKGSSRSTGALPGGLDGDRTHDLLFRPAQNWVKPASLDRLLKPGIPPFLRYRVSSLKPAKLAKSGGHCYRSVIDYSSESSSSMGFRCSLFTRSRSLSK